MTNFLPLFSPLPPLTSWYKMGKKPMNDGEGGPFLINGGIWGCLQIRHQVEFLIFELVVESCGPVKYYFYNFKSAEAKICNFTWWCTARHLRWYVYTYICAKVLVWSQNLKMTGTGKCEYTGKSIKIEYHN